MTYLVGLGVILTFTSALSGCGQAALCNRWVVCLRTAPVFRRTERLKEWVGLPLAAYVLAIVCNMGTSLLDGLDQDGGVLQAFYAIGLLALGAGAIMMFGSLIAVRPVVRTPWRDVGSWEALQAEVDEQLALHRLPDQAWLVGARHTRHRLGLADGQAQRLAARAGGLVPDRVVPGMAWPKWGFGVVRDGRGARIPIPWRCVVRWSARDRWTQVTLACAVVTLVLAAMAPAVPRSPSYAGAAIVATWLAAVLMSVILGARAFLLYYARLSFEWRDTARFVDAALGRWEREVRRNRRMPHQRTPR